MSCSDDCKLFSISRGDRRKLENAFRIRLGGGTYGNPCIQATRFCFDNELFPEMIKGVRLTMENTNIYSIMGAGDYGIVLGVCTGKNHKFAMKIASNVIGDPTNEFEMQRLFHIAGLAPEVYGIKRWEGKSFIFMEKIESTLKNYLVKNKESNSIDLKRIFNDIDDAMKEMHASGIFHGDMHLDNIAVKFDDRGGYDGITLIDFGFSQKVAPGCNHVTLGLQFFVEYLQILRTTDEDMGRHERDVIRIVMKKLKSRGLKQYYDAFVTGPDLETNHDTQDDTFKLAHEVLTHSSKGCSHLHRV